MSSPRSKSLGSFNAYACLLAVVLIYAPYIALWAGNAACCKGSYCPIRGHHHQNAPTSNEERGMDCGHDTAGMATCAMSLAV